MMNRRARSLLFVPADRSERFVKALAAGADAVVIDLEDAVAPAQKASARDAVLAWLDHMPASTPAAPAARQGTGRPAEPSSTAEPASEPVAMPLPASAWAPAAVVHSRSPMLMVRINGAETSWFADDLAVVARAGVAAIMVPKAERADTLAQVLGAGARALVPLIESAAGFARLREICAVPGVERLAFGTIDFQVDLGMRDALEDELLPYRSSIVLESRLAGIAPPVDGVSTAIDDLPRLADDVRRARRLGFGGKLCIHPRQVAQVNALFEPSAEELAWARRVLEASAAAGGAALAVDGKLVDKPVILRAQAIVREASPE